MSAAPFEGVTSVSQADVYKAGVRAATLTRTDEGVEFAYLESYLSAGGLAVATTLPPTDEPVRTVAGAVPPFFAGLLPEGRRLSALRRAVKTSADDELSLLLAVGRDTIGDVQVVSVGQEPAPSEALLVVERDWSEIRFAEVLAETGIVDAVSLPGVQDKVSARMISVPVGRAGERFILKLDPPEFPHVVVNEAFFIELARSARVPSAHGSVVHDAEGLPGLLVRRFDRVAEPGGGTRSLACEDACQVLGRWPADKYLVSYEQVVTALADRCPARPVALRALFQQLCYAWLTGNGDLHAKNASILATEDGEWRVAPAYDLPTTIPYGDLTMALPMSGRTSGLSRQQVLGFASEIGLAERAATAVLDELLERLIGLEELIRSSALPFGPDRSADLAAAFRYRRRQMLG